ncbi:MAG: DUF2892 domain-containing protein [Deltaproteobacteria bacterium]|nr:MAG: DUF2892 domain-containing protein [Deltaproteobacteria bacterium]
MCRLNEAWWDRAARILLGAVLLALGWGGFVTGTAGTVLKWVGFVPLLTGLVGYCPLYALFRFRTKPCQEAQGHLPGPQPGGQRA